MTLVDLIVQDRLKDAFKRWGVERTEEKLKEIFKTNSKALGVWLYHYNKLIKGD